MVSLEKVLEVWRQSIFFSERVLLQDGRVGIIAAWSPDGSMALLMFEGKKREEFPRDELFPFWWPDLLEAEVA